MYLSPNLRPPADRFANPWGNDPGSPDGDVAGQVPTLASRILSGFGGVSPFSRGGSSGDSGIGSSVPFGLSWLGGFLSSSRSAPGGLSDVADTTFDNIANAIDRALGRVLDFTKASDDAAYQRQILKGETALRTELIRAGALRDSGSTYLSRPILGTSGLGLSLGSIPSWVWILLAVVLLKK